ncbi:MAG: response regulator [Acidobacteriales bacterium]|nr:response regulator [Terriglobales bacterium]
MPGIKKKRAQILVVDDNKPHCYVLARMLEKAGYPTQQAHTGKDALQFAAQKPAVILLDIDLPDINGFEVLHRLQGDPATASIPVVFMSTTDVGAAKKIHDAQIKASGFLTQPVQQGHLLAVVEGVLSHRSKAQTVKNKAGRRN